MDIRVRFAPSPTGYFHIGSVRTALFNWLFSRQNGGKFVLRIEDTDKERSTKEYEEDILNSLKWLGFDYDEIYRQSERIDIYKKYLEKLIEENKAYYCFCKKENLEAERAALIAEGIITKYSGKCAELSKEEIQKKLEGGESSVIRIKIQEKEIVFNDLIKGQIKFNSKDWGDLVIAKNMEEPLYNFVAVIDDALMEISYVIRGEDHLSNTPKQILIAEILGFKSPKFAHMPLILNPDRSKMSKRFENTALKEYIADGYLPEAIINFTAMLGWHSKTDKEIMNLDDLLKEFELLRVQKSGAIFNIEKLNWLNSYYIKEKSDAILIQMLKDFIPKNWLANQELLINSVHLIKERLKKLSEFKDLAAFFFKLSNYETNLLIWKETTKEKTLNNLNLVLNILQAENFERKTIENKITIISEKEGRGEIYWPLRVALSGEKNSPAPMDILFALGKTESISRIEKAIKRLTMNHKQ